jgi:hypothetical protein
MSAVMRERRQLLNLTYRLLGSLTDPMSAVILQDGRMCTMLGMQARVLRRVDR